ncbi:MAG: putative virion core protein (lumpy skin disease virus)-like protein [Flavipsychrobacter sp.]|nr:putative virion core protein (lumpy skin disease virus)-like protein [Flavipsychrobacter sp.]
MGLFDKLRNEFIDIIEWPDQKTDTLVWKFPRYQNEIKMNAKLTVREAQQAVFINEGKIADVFQPGMYNLQTQNMPVMATLKGWKYGFDSPFKADVLFVSTRQAVDQKWGTKNAITLSDDRFGMIELRAFGTYAFKVTDAGKFIKEIAGIEREYTTDEIGGQLKSIIATRFTNAAGSGNIPIEKFASNLEGLSSIIMEKLNADFDNYGLTITNFLVENVSMPEELKKEIFEYSRLNKIDMQKLAQLKSAQSIEIAAANEGIGGIGAGLGAGIGVGNMMASTIGQATAPMQQAAGAMPPPLSVPAQYFTGVDGKQAGPFDSTQIQQMIQSGVIKRDSLMWKAGMAAWSAASGISELTPYFDAAPPPLI